MSARVDGSGVLCCGGCGARLIVACSANCATPDTEIPDNPIASLPLPKGRERPGGRAQRARRKFIVGICTYDKCDQPIAPDDRPGQKGRKSTKCVKHRELTRQWSARRKQQQVAA